MPKLTRLRETREKRFWSQADLAERAGVSRITISEIERGRAEARWSTSRKLAGALGVEPGDLVDQPDGLRPFVRQAHEVEKPDGFQTLIANIGPVRRAELDEELALLEVVGEPLPEPRRVPPYREPLTVGQKRALLRRWVERDRERAEPT
jgi:transcriptional regulator with XRE-family HTH domain